MDTHRGCTSRRLVFLILNLPRFTNHVSSDTANETRKVKKKARNRRGHQTDRKAGSVWELLNTTSLLETNILRQGGAE